MSVEQIKALTTIRGARGYGWKDLRARSPKALGDFSGVILPRVTSQGYDGLQDLDYDLMSRFYVCNDMVWTCINLVSSTAGLARLRVRKLSKGRFTYLDDHPLQKALDFPNGSMTQFDLIQAYVTHQLLFGTVTILLLRESMLAKCPVCISEGTEECLHALYLNTDGPIQQMMPVHPSNIIHKEVRTPDGKKSLVMFYVPNIEDMQKAYPVHPNNVLTDPIYNPNASWYGVSPTFLLQRWLKLDSSMTEELVKFFENGSIPSLIVSVKPGTNYTYDNEPNTLVQMLKDQWMAKFSGTGDAKKSPAFVFGDISVQKIQDRINDSIGKEIYYQIQSQVCATYGVPPTLYEVGMKYSSQRSSSEQQEKDFYNRTISKILTRFQAKINQLVVPSYNEKGLEVVWDLTNLGVARFLIDENDKRIQSHWLNGLITRNETRVLLKYEPAKDEFGDDYYRITVMGDGQVNTSNQLDNNLAPPNLDTGNAN